MATGGYAKGPCYFLCAKIELLTFLMVHIAEGAEKSDRLKIKPLHPLW